MINLEPVPFFALDDLRKGAQYAGDEIATQLIRMTYNSYFICEGNTRIGFLGLHKPGCLSSRGLLWLGLYPNFVPTRRLLRDAKNLGEVFFARHQLDIWAEVSRKDAVAIRFVKYFGMLPDIFDDNIQLYVRKN